MARCACVGCGNSGVVKIKTNHQTIGGIYLCRRHAESMEGYCYENDNHMGTSKKHGFTFGMEFESNHSTLYARGVLVENGFVPTSDGTVDVEYKSSIQHGLASFSQLYKSIDKLIASGDLSVADSRWSTCGTHFHVGHETMINRETMVWLRRFYNTMFCPLSDIMRQHSDINIALFGRDFTGYASPINARTSAVEHENFINLQHSYSIEFRLCKYQNCEQFTRLTHMLKEMGEAIVETYLKRYNLPTEHWIINNKRYTDENNGREYRKELARRTSVRLVNIYKKYAKKAGFEI